MIKKTETKNQKHIMDIKNKNPRKHINFLISFPEKWSLILVLLLYLNQFQVISNEAIFSDEINLHTEDLDSRIRNYTAKIFNFTVAYPPTKNERNLFPTNTNVFHSSFIFYADEDSSNLINHDDIIQRHSMYTRPRIKYSHKLQNKKINIKPSVDIRDSEEEDYFSEYEDTVTTKSGKNPTNSTTGSSCSSCQQHEKAKEESLESIKKHILMRLQLTQPPVISVPPPIVPQKILDIFYKNQNYSKTMMLQSIFNHNFNNKIHKMKKKVSATKLEDELRDEADEDLSSRSLKEDHSVEEYDNDHDDFMISDDRYEYDYEHFATSNLLQADEFYSRLHSIYVFPTKSRFHHNRKPEIFNFKFNSDPSRITSTILHIYIKGQNWFYEYQPDALEKEKMEMSMKKKPEIMIVIYRALRRPNSMNYTHTVKLVESRQKIPPGKGQWVEIEIKELSSYWMKTPNATQSIVIRGMESWMRSFIVTEEQANNKSLTMHIEVVTKSKSRYKRNAALDCRESDNEVRCCRYPLKVNFTNFGWSFIVAPQHFDAYFCNGECNVGYLEKYTHTHLTSLSTSAKPCCSPQKLSPLALLYFDNNKQLMYSTIPNMSVEKCSCS